MNDLDHDIRVWLSRAQYQGLRRLAEADDRPMSAYVRRLICRALDESMDEHDHGAMPRAGSGRPRAGR